MHAFFKPLTTADDIAAQRERMMQESAAAAALSAAERKRYETTRRGPGRPRTLVNAHSVLTESAGAALDDVTSTHSVLTQSESAGAAIDDVTSDNGSSCKRARGKYTNWFATPFIHDILHAFQLMSHSGKRTVAHLQRTFPRLPTEAAARFDDLSESTIRSWHDNEGKLLPKFAAIIQEKRSAAERGPGRARVLLPHPEIETEIKRILTIMRERGAVVNILIIRLVMRAVIEKMHPPLLQELKLCSGFISSWARDQLNMTWRVRTGAASKLPVHWRELGVAAAKRIAWNMVVHDVPACLVINMDQTGVHLAPVDNRTYDEQGSKHVKVIGGDDKRQITACIASSLAGDLLPLQLIFQGKTILCHPPITDAAKQARVHITHSHNHWSSLQTMKEYIKEVIVPYAERTVPANEDGRPHNIVLVLDVWSVHKGTEFRAFLRTEHPNIRLVFVPANCTSQLQVADVILQRPFKHGLRSRFNIWAADIIREQIEKNDVTGLAPYLKMASIKPLVLQWCIDSWSKMKHGRDFIKMGWHTCVVSLYNVHDPKMQQAARREVELQELDAHFVPQEVELQGEYESESDIESDHEEDEMKDELDIMRERQYGSRRSERKRKQSQPAAGSYLLNSSLLAFSGESEKE